MPFCRFKCTYCNFASGVFTPREMECYIEALCAEIRGAKVKGSRADTVYLGGGTPSILSPAQLERVFAALRSSFDVSGDAEITLEAAPGSITPELAGLWQKLGINRVSLGVQSFVERELKATGRPHRAETVKRDLALLRQAGIRDANIDLIAGLPHQTSAGWDQSLDWIARLRPEHVSVYILEIDKDSRLGSEVLAGGSRYSASSLPGDDATADYYCHAIERLEEMGCHQYEISNFAIAGHESRHNRKYWEHAPYLGFGVDAHSFDGCERWANADSLDSYLEAAENGRSPVVARHALDERRQSEERIFLGLRQNRGIELAEEECARYRREIDKMSLAGLLEVSGGTLRLTPRGRLLSNEVFAEFIET